MRLVKVLLVSADPKMRELMGVAVSSVERALGEPVHFLEAGDGVEGLRKARREPMDFIVAEQSSSRAGAFALAKDLRSDAVPYPGGIVVLLDRAQDWWLAQWSGADAWFTKPVDPFALADTVVGMAQGRRDREHNELTNKETA
jgi:DNA-binding response OmpR family regulator